MVDGIRMVVVVVVMVGEAMTDSNIDSILLPTGINHDIRGDRSTP